MVWFVGSASGIFTPFSTASTALPPLLKTSHAPTLAVFPKSQVETTTGLFLTILISSCSAANTLLPEIAAAEPIKEVCKIFYVTT
jgi:hypothetical protein